MSGALTSTPSFRTRSLATSHHPCAAARRNSPENIPLQPVRTTSQVVPPTPLRVQVVTTDFFFHIKSSSTSTSIRHLKAKVKVKSVSVCSIPDRDSPEPILSTFTSSTMASPKIEELPDDGECWVGWGGGVPARLAHAVNVAHGASIIPGSTGWWWCSYGCGVFFVGSFGLPSSWVVCVWLDDRPDGDLLAWVCECGWVWLCGMSGGWIGDFTDPPAHPQPLDDDVNSVCVSGAWCSRARHTHIHTHTPLSPSRAFGWALALGWDSTPTTTGVPRDQA